MTATGSCFQLLIIHIKKKKKNLSSCQCHFTFPWAFHQLPNRSYSTRSPVSLDTLQALSSSKAAMLKWKPSVFQALHLLSPQNWSQLEANCTHGVELTLRSWPSSRGEFTESKLSLGWSSPRPSNQRHQHLACPAPRARASHTEEPGAQAAHTSHNCQWINQSNLLSQPQHDP